ncbi:zinc-binding domain-containing protein [Aspergillus granulosus]|uniref:Zinc-binding domain-containing protein n=1 Tax=Aspergillus granulosus TaxID=176169 RepID=A0ABR4GVR9_9EURO
MPRKGRKAAKLWSLHPKLHDDVARLLDEEGLQLDFFDADDEETNVEERDTNVMGRFICQNSGCYSSGWSSKKIAITIRMYPRQRYNARVYHQRCRNCRAVGRLILDTGCYAERVTYWLKKWNGIEVQRPDYSSQSRGPHDSELCEGCKVGHCPNSNEDLALVLARLSI